MFLQIFAGLLYSLSFEPVGLWFFAPVALALQLYGVRRFSRPELQSFLFALTSALIILNWSKTFVGVLPWIALAFLQGLLAIPIGIVARLTSGFPPLVFTILLMEEVRARFPFGGFSWTRIAFSQSDSPFSPLIAFTGILGLSLVTLLIAQSLLHLRIKNSLLLLSLLAGSFLMSNPINESASINIRAIQGGVPERGLAFNARAQEVLDNHIKVTIEDFSREDDLILWPENAIDIDPTRNGEVATKIRDLSSSISRPLVAGAILDGEKLYNSTILFDSEGEISSTYLKRYLTPFGEFIPLRSIASHFSKYVDDVSDFSPGEFSVVHQIEGAKLGSVICYELLNDGLVRQAATESDFLVVHTNSATFSGSSEGEQQLAITRLRAIESRKSIVSISTTGPSAVINARGEVLAKLNNGEIGSLAAAIPLNQTKSVAHALGGLTVPLVLLLTLIWAILSSRYSRNERRWR